MNIFRSGISHSGVTIEAAVEFHKDERHNKNDDQ